MTDAKAIQQANARIALACLDLTSLNDDDTASAVATLCAKAHGPAGPPAALCVWPRFVAQAKSSVPDGVVVAAVVNFPDGGADQAAAVAETRAIVAAGGHEVDLVLPWRRLRSGDAASAAAMVQAVRAACPDQRLKLIIESGELTSVLSKQACQIGLDTGVDFLETSTDKSAQGASPEAARLMLQAIARHPRGAKMGFKASGGVRTVADAAVYIDLVRELLGEAALNPDRLRFGASALLGDIEAVLRSAGSAPEVGTSSTSGKPDGG